MTITLCEGWRLRPLDHLQWVVERLDGAPEGGSGLAGERMIGGGLVNATIATSSEPPPPPKPPTEPAPSPAPVPVPDAFPKEASYGDADDFLCSR
jgi:hypothetical protein